MEEVFLFMTYYASHLSNQQNQNGKSFFNAVMFLSKSTHFNVLIYSENTTSHVNYCKQVAAKATTN